MLFEYIFVYSEFRRNYPENYRILEEGETEEDVPDLNVLTGTVPHNGVSELRSRLEARYPKNEYRIARSRANTWMAIERSYAGMDYEYD